MANPRKRKQRIREALTKLVNAAAAIDSVHDDDVVLAAANAAVKTGVLTQQEYEEVISPLTEKQEAPVTKKEEPIQKASVKKTTTKKAPTKKKTRVKKKSRASKSKK